MLNQWTRGDTAFQGYARPASPRGDYMAAKAADAYVKRAMAVLEAMDEDIRVVCVDCGSIDRTGAHECDVFPPIVID